MEAFKVTHVMYKVESDNLAYFELLIGIGKDEGLIDHYGCDQGESVFICYIPDGSVHISVIVEDLWFDIINNTAVIYEGGDDIVISNELSESISQIANEILTLDTLTYRDIHRRMEMIYLTSAECLQSNAVGQVD